MDVGLVSGKFDLADVLFLIAAVLFLLAAWNNWPERRISASLTPLGLALVAIALFVL